MKNWYNINVLLLAITTATTTTTQLLFVGVVYGIQQVSTVKNLRPVVVNFATDNPRQQQTLLYRSAALDDLSIEDAKMLLDGSAFGTNPNSLPLAAVIDLRNRDEIQKGEKKRSEGAKFFYSSCISNDNYNYNNSGMKVRNSSTTIDTGTSTLTTSTTTTTSTKIINIPILRDVNAFWDEAINRMDPADRMKATMQTIFQGGALDRAAARNLERGGPAALYTIMMATATDPIGLALKTCLQEIPRGPVIFHCQKGKDRTGILAMLLQHCLGETKERIVESYSLSGELLGGEDAPTDTTNGNNNNKEEKEKNGNTSNSGMIDWTHFRGSPPTAMVETMDWIDRQYGSIDAYLDIVSFGENERNALREYLKANQ